MLDQFSGTIVFNSKTAGFDEVNEYYPLLNYNLLMVSGFDNSGSPLIAAVNMSNAKVEWKLQEKFGKVIAAREFANKKILIVTLFDIFKVDANTGAIEWKKTTSRQAAKMENSGLGRLFKDVVVAATKNTDIELTFFFKPGSDYFFLGGVFEQEDTEPFSDKKIIKYSSSLNAYDAETGDYIWDSELELTGHIGEFIFQEDGFVIIPIKDRNARINKYDYTTGKPLWGKRGIGIRTRGGLTNFINTNSGYLVATEEFGRYYINFIDLKTGAQKFKKPVRIKGNLDGVISVENKHLVISTNGLNVLDENSQSLLWKKDLSTSSNLVAIKDNSLYAFDDRKDILKKVDLNAMSVSDVSSEKIKFKGSESPNKIEVLEDGVLLFSDQNIAKIKFDGSLAFNNYYAAPKAPALIQILGIAASIAASFEANLAENYATELSRVQRGSNQQTNKFVDDLQKGYSDYANSASKFAKDTWQAVTSRKKASKFGRAYNFMMTKKDRDIVLYRISKQTGQPEGEINLGKNRKPNYDVDYVTNMVYYQKGNTLKAYNVK